MRSSVVTAPLHPHSAPVLSCKQRAFVCVREDIGTFMHTWWRSAHLSSLPPHKKSKAATACFINKVVVFCAACFSRGKIVSNCAFPLPFSFLFIKRTTQIYSRVVNFIYFKYSHTYSYFILNPVPNHLMHF